MAFTNFYYFFTLFERKILERLRSFFKSLIYIPKTTTSPWACPKNQRICPTKEPRWTRPLSGIIGPIGNRRKIWRYRRAVYLMKQKTISQEAPPVNGHCVGLHLGGAEFGYWNGFLPRPFSYNIIINRNILSFYLF